MLELGVQTQNIIFDENPAEGFALLRRAGFSCCDFSLNGYLKNAEIYQSKLNRFFDGGVSGLCEYFAPHKEAAAAAGVRIHQMHMPYPLYVPQAPEAINAYLRREVMPKSIELCRFLDCGYIVLHGLKLRYFLGSEEAEWAETERLIDSVAPLAAEYGITVCIENLYESMGGHLTEGPCCDAEKAAGRIDACNEKYGAEVLGFCFDIGHANLIGLDFERFLTTLGKRLKVLHLHDNDGVSDLHQLPFTFTRTRENLPSTDWEGFVRGLRAIGFDGVLSFETAPVLQSFPAAMKEDVLSFIARIGRYLAKEAEGRPASNRT